MPAKTLDDVYPFFQNKPVNLDNFEELYVSADRGRGRTPVFKRLKRRLMREPDGSLKMLFAGHKGCGKTTELVRLQRDIQHDFVILNFSAVQELDILNINYIELFIVAMSKLFEFAASEPRITVEPKYIESVRNWLATNEIEEINQQYMGMDLTAGAKAGADLPFLASFFAKFTASAKTSSSLKEVLKKKVEPKLSDLIFHCNNLIHQIKGQLSKIGKKGLLIIFEDLDKADLQKGEDIFYVHSAQLAQLNCHCIFTFPIALLYNIRFGNIKTSYSEDFVLPMIKVQDRNGDEYSDGIDVMTRITAQRMDLSLFDDPDILKQMILFSGGCLWDLFQLVKDAADYALDFDREKINRDDFDAARKILKRDYEFTIAEDSDREITVDQYFDALQACATDPKKKPESTEVILDLRNNRTVLSYNDEYWSDVHPAVREILEEKGLI
jgi:hypothetical protein